jgi:hypothetical protein
MNLFPFREKVRLVLCRLIHQPAYVSALDADAFDHLGLTVRSEQIDFCLPRAGNVNMGGLMIQGIDHEPEAVGAVYDNHCSEITHLMGYFNATAIGV